MELDRLRTAKHLNVVGINSGTSADGVDLSTVRIGRIRGRVTTKYVCGTHRAYPTQIREELLRLADSRTYPVDKLVLLDHSLGKYYANVCRQEIKRLKRHGHRVHAIACHGQTVRHLPKASFAFGQPVRGTLQIGEPSYLATVTGLPVVADFRPADIAAGYEGAPITVAAMHRLFADPKKPRLIVNIGGMSNYFYFPANSEPQDARAADCGPGNSLSDILSRELLRADFDHNGRAALSGTVDEKIVRRYVKQAQAQFQTVSTGRELFGTRWANRLLTACKKARLTKRDTMATAAEITVRLIAQRLQTVVEDDKDIAEVYLCGGGVKNRFFVRRLKQLMTDLSVQSIQELGFLPQRVEASAYAVMGEACLRGEALASRGLSGQSKGMYPILGKIVQSPGRI